MSFQFKLSSLFQKWVSRISKEVSAKMKFKRIHMVLIPTVLLFGGVLFVYQNCSRKASFESSPSTKANQDKNNDDPLEDGGENGNPPTDPSVSGDSDVLIHFREKPMDVVTGGPDPVVDYEVRPNEGTTVDEVECMLDGKPVPCELTDRLPINAPAPGPHRFEIVVRTNDGKTVKEVVEWMVYEQLTRMSTDILVGDEQGTVDIIINVDNSGSMELEQRSMARRISSLIERIQTLDYRVAIITTSPSDPEVWTDRLNYVDGKFVPVASNLYCIRRGSHSPSEVHGMIQNAVVRDLYLRDPSGNQIINPNTNNPRPQGSGWERGIFTTYRAFERSSISGSPESRCLRSGVAKHVILISDERETMRDDLGNPLPDLFKSDGTRLRQLVARIFGASTIFKFHSIIVNPYTQEGVECLSGARGAAGARAGIEYAKLSLDTGGYIGSICASDYGTQLGRIGTAVVSSNKLSFTLACVAVPNDGVYGNVVDLSTNQLVSGRYFFRGDKVEFETALTPGKYRVNYYCYQ